MIIIGQFGRTIGLKGQLRIESFLSKKSDILNFQHFFLEGKTPIAIQIKQSSNLFTATIKGVNNSDEAQKLVKKFLLIEKESLPKLDEKKFYYHELEKMSVFVSKKNIGKVYQVSNHGAGDYLDIRGTKLEILVPFNFDHVLDVNLKKRSIFLNPEYYEI